MTSRHGTSTRRYALLALAIGALWLGAGAPASGGDSWSPRVAISDEKGGRHEGTLEGFVLELKGHPTVSPTDKIELNGEARRASDLAGIRFTWTAAPGRRGESLSASFEFSDGSVVEPQAPKEGAAPVTALSFTFAEEGRDRLSWSFQAGQPYRSPLGRFARIDVVVKGKGDEGEGDQGKGDEGKGDQGKGDEGKGDQGKGDQGKGDQGKGDGAGAGPMGELSVVAFEDANANRAQDRGERGLPERQFTVTGPDGASSNLVTESDGTITAKLPVGRYTVVLMEREGWKTTTTATQDVIVDVRKPARVAFGIRKGDEGGDGGHEGGEGATGELSIVAFNDENGNSVQDRGERGLTEWQFTVMGTDRASSNLVTESDGTISAKLPVGRYTVVETEREGWKTTSPATQDVFVDARKPVRIAFGNRKGDGGGEGGHEGGEGATGELTIVAFNDENGNGVQDQGEPGLPDWEFKVSGPDGVSKHLRTQGDGTYRAVFPVGRHAVAEAGQGGWTQTTPDQQDVVVDAKRPARVLFGNRKGDGGGDTGHEGGEGRTGELCIIKFEDTNGNGKQDNGEATLSDWQFTVTGPGGVSSTLVTQGDGTICHTFPAGQYTVVETGRSAWTATTPTNQSVIVTAGQRTTVAFGNRRGGQCDPLPPNVVVDPASCKCNLGALPLPNEIILRWSLCPIALSVAGGQARLYRADHGHGNWQVVHPSSGVSGVLSDSALALASLGVSPSDQELFRDVVRHYKNPGAYVESPPPAGQTAAEAATEVEEIRDFAYIVLVTRFGLKLHLMEAIGLGIVDTDVSAGSLYDYVLTIWTSQVETLCSRVDGVGPLEAPATPPPTGPGAEVLRSRMPDLPGARRPDYMVTPIGVKWTSAPQVPDPHSEKGASQIHTECSPLSPAPSYAEGTFNVVAYQVERRDSLTVTWTKLKDGLILEVERIDKPEELTGDPPPSPPAGYRYLDIDTKDHITYFYRITSLDLLGRTSVPTAEVFATAFAIPSPIAWKSFTASWNVPPSSVDESSIAAWYVTHRSVDVVLTLKLPSGRELWVERTCPTDADPEAGLVRLNSNSPWTGAGPFSLADATAVEKKRYVYKIVIDEPAAGGTIDMNIRATMVVPDLTAPDPPPQLQFVPRPGTPIPDAVTEKLIDETLEDQKNEQKWIDTIAKVKGLIADERALLLPKTVSSTETVVLTGTCAKIEVSLDELEGAAPKFDKETLPYPPRAELLYTNGERVQGLLQELDIEGPSLHVRLLPSRAPIQCDGHPIPWDNVNSISFLWRVSQPGPRDTPLRAAFPWITDTIGEVAFPKVGTEPASATMIHLVLAGTVGTGDPTTVTWDFDSKNQAPGAREIRSVRLLDTPWRLGTPGETFTYVWADPDRLRPPEGEVTKVEIDPTAAPGRKATVTGSQFPSAVASSAWSVRGHLVSLGVVMKGSKGGEPPGSVPLNANSPGLRVTIDAKDYWLDDLIRVEIVWGSSGRDQRPTKVTLTFHQAAELKVEELPNWEEPDIKARALSMIEEERFAPHMADIKASREGVILYWSYPPPNPPEGLAGFNVYRATGDAPTVFTRINPEPIPFEVVKSPLGAPPSSAYSKLAIGSGLSNPPPPTGTPPVGWPPASAGTGTLCWFEDDLLGGVGSKYYYRVTAVDDTGQESAPSSETGLQVTVPDRAGPPAPVLVSVKKQHSNGALEVQIKWRKPTSPYYVVVYRREAGSTDPATWVPVHTANPSDPTEPPPDNLMSCTDPGPFPALQRYEYFLRGGADNDGVIGTLGKLSAMRSVEIRAEDIPPVVSALPTAVAGVGGVTLAWVTPTLPTGVTVKHYVVERREAVTPPTAPLAFQLRAGPMTATTFVDDRVTAGKTYEYRIVLIDSNDAVWTSVYALVRHPAQ